MIPADTPTLTGLSVLVTRPQPQAERLSNRIVALGGEPIRFPAIQIVPLQPSFVSVAPPALAIFVSANAVRHGLSLMPRDAGTIVVAIGPATAQSLADAGVEVDVVPEAGFDSETLLGNARLKLPAGARAVIVRGVGGRELLRETLAQRGLQVEVLEVYERARASPEARTVESLEMRWLNDGIGIVTVTSGDILDHLIALLTEAGRSMLVRTPVLVVSERLAALARQRGCEAECLISPAPDDAAILGTLATWHTRARLPRRHRR